MLKIIRLRFEFVVKKPFQLGLFPGSTWRGVLGYALQGVLCPLREKHPLSLSPTIGALQRKPCEKSCERPGHCDFEVFFGDHDGKNASARWFVLEPDNVGEQLLVNDRIGVNIVLIEQGINYLTAMVEAMQDLENFYLGLDEGQVQLERVFQQSPDEQWQPLDLSHELLITPLIIPPAPQCVTFFFHTPLSITVQDKETGKKYVMKPEDFDLGRLLLTINRRVESFTGADKQLVPEGIELKWQSLSFWQQKRFSTLQQKRMRMSGLLGFVEIAGEDLAAMWGNIWLGQWLHLGSHTTFGFGQYQLLDPQWQDYHLLVGQGLRQMALVAQHGS